MRRIVSIIGAVVILLSAAVSVSAHHAFAGEFDNKKLIKIRGTLTKAELINPHAWLHIDVKGEDGKSVEWMIEGPAPNALLRRGWTKNSLPVGAEILVEGFQAKDGTNKASVTRIRFADGKTVWD